MTRYLVTDNEIHCAIHDAISKQDIDRQGPNYVIRSSQDVVSHVLRLLDKYKVAEEEQTDNSKQDSRRETDASEYPVIRIGDVARNELVGMICEAYKNGLAD